MAGIYSTLLAWGVPDESSPGVVYTVPSGVTVVVRSIQLYCASGSANSIDIVDQALVRLAHLGPSDSGAYLEVSLRRVMNPAQEISVGIDAGIWTYAISGYVLDA